MPFAHALAPLAASPYWRAAGKESYLEGLGVNWDTQAGVCYNRRVSPLASLLNPALCACRRPASTRRRALDQRLVFLDRLKHFVGEPGR